MPNVPAGFPDWYRLSSRAQETYVYDDQSSAVNVDYGPFYVGGQVSLGIRSTISNAGISIFLNWFLDQAMTQPLGSDGFDKDVTGAGLNLSIPVRGPWVKVTVQPNAGVTHYNIAVWATTGVFQRTGQFLGDGPILMVRNNFNVGAGATLVVTTPRIWVGAAYWTCILEAGASNRLTLEAVDASGAVFLLDYGSQVNVPSARQVFLPPMRVQVRVFNNDAVIRPLYLSVVGRPLGPGG